MVITHYGGEFIKITHGDTTLAFNPISKDSKLSGPKFGADVVLITTADKDFNGVGQMTRGDKEPFVAHGPGEYEVEKIFIKGFPSISHYGGYERPNTIYIVTLDGMNICFLGALSQSQVDPKILEDVDGIDILFVPIGSDGVLTPTEAHSVGVKLEAKVVVPIHYDGMGGKDSLTAFLKESGAEKEKPVDKLTVKKKDVEGKVGEIVVITS
ncbi:MBL fold metallo-hydrolase [Candidatus Kaiserbacteria bacterium]|nr:MBL fold metallo-hydrolase [Candidatus Kaiserbacteria bacterium]